MKVIIINGMAQAGKSTFVNLCQNLHTNTFELSMVDFVKMIAKQIGWDQKKDEKGRKFLADLKDCIENYDRNIIYNSIDRDMFYFVSHSCGCGCEPVFFINARSPEDIEYLKIKYNAVTLFITNPRISDITTNHADANVNKYAYDFYIENNGTMADFEKKAKTFINNILKNEQ